MDGTEYQREVTRTMNHSLARKHALTNYALGLCGESGEVGELIKKHAFHGHTLDTEKLAKEIGDVLWYAAALADEAGLSLEVIMHKNVLKLRERYPFGFTHEDSIARKDENLTPSQAETLLKDA
jgi:NTP pyrophosphatase (non-canonical NTP hydrolase)